jgi:histidinol-phosphate aminotransferase
MDGAIRLNANEACWSGDTNQPGISLNRYPDVRPMELRARLAKWYGVRDENLLVTRGSSEAIDLLIRAFCRAGQDNIVLTPPTFDMYRLYADIHGTDIVSVPIDASRDFSVDCDALIAGCTPGSKLIFLCSPGNPTGRPVPRSTILALLEARRNQSIVVVDEAYVEFGDSDSMAELVNEFDNLAVLRTVSKALALAGTRCGCAIASSEIIDVLDRIMPPYSMPTPAVSHVIDAMEPERLELAMSNVAKTIAARSTLAESLRELPIVDRIWPSSANFLLVRFHDAQLVHRMASKAGILLRRFPEQPALENCLRITVGSNAEIATLLDVLSSIEAGANV